MEASEDFQQLALRFTDPIQFDYEVIREVVLADETIQQRSRVTGIDRATVAEKARRFVQEGMLGLIDRRRGPQQGRQPYPDVVAGYILYIKQLCPALHDREIARIVQRKYGCKTNHHTVRLFLRRHPIPVQLPLPITRFHTFDDAYQARWTVVRLFYEGWHQQSIATFLGLSRQHVWTIVEHFKRDEFAGLEEHRTRPANHPANQLTLPFIKEVLDLQQEYPRAGEFRVHGLLVQQHGDGQPSTRTVGRAMAINRAHHDAPGPWVTDAVAPMDDGMTKYLPFEPTYPHRFWFLDFRYLVRLGDDDHWVYSLCIFEGYSRKILAGMATEYQDTVAVLQLLTAAFAEYGRPRGMVSDNGAVFTSDAYEGLLRELEIKVCHIEKGKPWEDLAEAQFKVQLRLADRKFELAQDFLEVQQRHAEFVETFNTTDHWAHRERADGRRTPEAVLDARRARLMEAGQLQQALRHLQVGRIVNSYGYVSIQRFYIYAERGLARQRVSIWLYDGHLHIAHQEALLARYRYRADRADRRLHAVERPELFETAYASPQLELFELDDALWRKVLELAPRHRHPRGPQRTSEQLVFPFTALLTLVVGA